VHARWIARQATHVVPLREQSRDDQRADEAARAGDENTHLHIMTERPSPTQYLAKCGSFDAIVTSK
jgi:hypothetical protein